ncbi:ankyrin repeat domain-containing protein [Mucilaginibacter sp. L196]|uniref:ankyrin repeat domain-containing protein n=1 Tax=Mucilaginibacter sp. L196 TaxID=1641870 RepID=UPI00131D1864|nr:ankyrin repeat domain-containing protein [Mucilaginibacter sp. L196]
MAKKRKTLPKNFKELIEASNIGDLIAVFETCELNATGGYPKETALSFYDVPEELIRWLIANGADVNIADDIYNRTPLHEHAMRWNGNVAVLLELGANIEAKDTNGNTPLHMAAGNGFNLNNVQLLVLKGADITIKNDRDETPLLYALKRANNINIVNLVAISDILLQEGTVSITVEMQKAITSIGESFEFHREGFKKESLTATDEALSQLYKKFNVTPIKKRLLHDGISPITVTALKWEDQYNELWDLLVPSSGPAKTVQGEVVRITGKVRDEIYRNGGVNWSSDFKRMLDDLISHLGTGVSLNETLLNEATAIAKEIRRTGNGDDEPSRLCELATTWVMTNPNSILLSKPKYNI